MEGVTSECEKGEKRGVDKVGAGQRSELTKICCPNTFDLIRVGENRMNKVEEEVTC